MDEFSEKVLIVSCVAGLRQSFIKTWPECDTAINLKELDK